MAQRFIMLVGIAGSGKSTYARLFIEHRAQTDEDIIILSSDEVRAELYGDASIQANPAHVFEILNQRTLNALKEGRSVIYDATNLIASRRTQFLTQIKQIAPDCFCACVVCDTPIDECIERQSLRDRQVPTSAIQRQSKQLQFPQYSEGWDRIVFSDNDSQIEHRSWRAHV